MECFPSLMALLAIPALCCSVRCNLCLLLCLQVCTNFVSNAIKFSPHDGSGRVQLLVEARIRDIPQLQPLPLPLKEQPTSRHPPSQPKNHQPRLDTKSGEATAASMTTSSAGLKRPSFGSSTNRVAPLPAAPSSSESSSAGSGDPIAAASSSASSSEQTTQNLLSSSDVGIRTRSPAELTSASAAAAASVPSGDWLALPPLPPLSSLQPGTAAITHNDRSSYSLTRGSSFAHRRSRAHIGPPSVAANDSGAELTRGVDPAGSSTSNGDGEPVGTDLVRRRRASALLRLTDVFHKLNSLWTPAARGKRRGSSTGAVPDPSAASTTWVADPADETSAASSQRRGSILGTARGAEVPPSNLRNCNDETYAAARQSSLLSSIVPEAGTRAKALSEMSLANLQLAGQVVDLTITCRDNGCGISEAELPKIFQPFQQLSSGQQYKGRGTGLGLAIAKNIITTHNGAVGVSSVEREGSDFWLQVPLAVLQPKPSPAAAPQQQQSLLSPSAAATADDDAAPDDADADEDEGLANRGQQPTHPSPTIQNHRRFPHSYEEIDMRGSRDGEESATNICRVGQSEDCALLSFPTGDAGTALVVGCNRVSHAIGIDSALSPLPTSDNNAIAIPTTKGADGKKMPTSVADDHRDDSTAPAGTEALVILPSSSGSVQFPYPVGQKTGALAAASVTMNTAVPSASAGMERRSTGAADVSAPGPQSIKQAIHALLSPSSCSSSRRKSSIIVDTAAGAGNVRSGRNDSMADASNALYGSGGGNGPFGSGSSSSSWSQTSFAASSAGALQQSLSTNLGLHSNAALAAASEATASSAAAAGGEGIARTGKAAWFDAAPAAAAIKSDRHYQELGLLLVLVPAGGHACTTAAVEALARLEASSSRLCSELPVGPTEAAAPRLMVASVCLIVLRSLRSCRQADPHKQHLRQLRLQPRQLAALASSTNG